MGLHLQRSTIHRLRALLHRPLRPSQHPPIRPQPPHPPSTITNSFNRPPPSDRCPPPPLRRMDARSPRASLGFRQRQMVQRQEPMEIRTRHFLGRHHRGPHCQESPRPRRPRLLRQPRFIPQSENPLEARHHLPRRPRRGQNPLHQDFDALAGGEDAVCANAVRQVARRLRGAEVVDPADFQESS